MVEVVEQTLPEQEVIVTTVSVIGVVVDNDSVVSVTPLETEDPAEVTVYADVDSKVDCTEEVEDGDAAGDDDKEADEEVVNGHQVVITVVV